MRTIVLRCCLVAAFSVLALQPVSAAHHHGSVTRYVRLAPADEYFGRQKMSILEVGNRLRDMSRCLRSPSPNTRDILHTAQMTEDAMRDWARKYPSDPWLRKDRTALLGIYKSARSVQH